MNYRFDSPPIVAGWNALSVLAEVQGRRAAIITDAGVMERLGVIDCARTHLARAGVQSEIAGRLGREPCISDVAPLVEALARSQPDVIVALGGGSVMDAAKAARAFYERPGLDWETAFQGGSLPRTERCAQFIAIPTTSGTGSEVSKVAVLIDDETRLKRLIMSLAILPTLAIVDPALAAMMPPPLAAHTAFDALTHAVEAMVAAVATEFSVGYALHAIRLIAQNLPATCHGERPAREKLHLAATLAGLAVNNSTAGMAHGMDQVGPLFDLPHGLVCAILLPHTVAFNLEHAVEQYGEMGAAVGAAEASALDRAGSFLRRLVDLQRAAGLPQSFEQAGVDRRGYVAHMETMVSATLASRSVQLSPRVPVAHEAEELFERAFWGELQSGVR